MCGRFFRHTPREELAAAMRAQIGHASATPAYNIAPGISIIAVRYDARVGVRTLDDLHWGLVPHFAKDPKVGWRNINARAETIDAAPSHRLAFQKHRCLIPADGFFEWKKIGKRRQPYAVAREDRKPLAMAGLWSNWRDPETGEWLRSCAIVTTEANQLLKGIHDRMPVILSPSDYALWLGEEPASPEALKAILKPYDPGQLTLWPVSSLMNRQDAFEGPGVLNPIDVPDQA